MNIGKTLFAQVMDFVPWTTFERLVGRYGGDHRVRRFRCAEQFRVMAFAHKAFRESLRDVEVCLSVQSANLYQIGLRSSVSRSTLADANESRDWRIYADLAQRLIIQARKLCANDTIGIGLEETVYALDSTTIRLCLSMFPWAPFRETKAAINLHTLLDLRGSIPAFIYVSDGKLHDVNAMDVMPAAPGAIYLMDRAHVDFERLFALQDIGAFFVTRAKSNLRCRRIYSAPVDRSRGRFCGQCAELMVHRSIKEDSEKRWRIKYVDPETDQCLVFLANHFGLPALTICALYKNRWQVDLFFKWIRQNLRIKRFYGTSENAVKTQIWTAVSVYVLIAIV